MSQTLQPGRVKPVHKKARQLPFPLNIYQTAVGKKWVMALTGVALLGFVLVHMIGNLHMYEGPNQVNQYAESLRELGGHLAPRTLVLEGVFDPAAISDLPGLSNLVTDAADDGAVRVTAALKTGAPAQEVLKSAFAKGLDIQKFELREPHLHDAFIVLTTKGGRA